MGVGVGVCNYKGAACKTEIMKEKKKKNPDAVFGSDLSRSNT